MGNPQIMKQLAEMWHKASWEEKAECQKEADKDRERYEQQMKDYKPPTADMSSAEEQREVCTLHSHILCSNILGFGSEICICTTGVLQLQSLFSMEASLLFFL